MRTWIQMIAVGGVLGGCVRPLETPPPGGQTGPGPAAGLSAGPDAPSAGPGAPPAGPPPDEPADAALDPLHPQDTLGDGPSVEGVVHCADCSGTILLRVLPPPPDQGGGELVLVTTATIAAPGAFRVKLPPGLGPVVVQAVEDSDGNGRPDRGERIGFSAGGPVDGGAGARGLEIRIDAGDAPPPAPPAGAR
jgi:hypothetical protein